MKATIDFDPVLYQRLKLEAVRRGRTIKELVADGVQLVLARPHMVSASPAGETPEWLGGLRRYAGNAGGVHDLPSVRSSISRKRLPRAR